jgi:hypothetical protein
LSSELYDQNKAEERDLEDLLVQTLQSPQEKIKIKKNLF